MGVEPAPMPKVQVQLREDQTAALRSIAARTGQRPSDLIQRGVDLLIETAKTDDGEWREGLLSVAGAWSGHDDLESLNRDLRAAVRKRFEGLLGRAE
jgi:hypothetical protein